MALGGCGGHAPPRLEASDAAPLIALAHRIARESACGQAHDIATLRSRAIALVNARRVPAALEEPLMSGVGALAADAPVCLAKVTPAAPSPRPKPRRERHGHEHRHRHKEQE